MAEDPDADDYFLHDKRLMLASYILGGMLTGNTSAAMNGTGEQLVDRSLYFADLLIAKVSKKTPKREPVGITNVAPMPNDPYMGKMWSNDLITLVAYINLSPGLPFDRGIADVPGITDAGLDAAIREGLSRGLLTSATRNGPLSLTPRAVEFINQFEKRKPAAV